MKRSSTILLKLSICAMVFAALGLCVLLPLMLNLGSDVVMPVSHLRYPVLLVLYAVAAVFLAALYQVLKLVRYIDKNMAFSQASVKALKKIKYCAGAVCALLTATGLPFFYYIADIEDAPGLMIIGMAIAFVPFVIAVFTSVLQRLLQDAVNVKSENDLTI